MIPMIIIIRRSRSRRRRVTIITRKINGIISSTAFLEAMPVVGSLPSATCCVIVIQFILREAQKPSKKELKQKEKELKRLKQADKKRQRIKIANMKRSRLSSA